MASGYASTLFTSQMSAHAGGDPTHAWLVLHVEPHMLGSSGVVHCFVVLMHCWVEEQNWARQGVVLTVTASWNVQLPAAGVALALVAMRTFEMSAPFVPPAAIDWYAITKVLLRNSIFAYRPMTLPIVESTVCTLHFLPSYWANLSAVWVLS